jgi:photosynthetic reaction center H subunit
MNGTFFGNFDLASLAIWMFWAFFAVLVFYLQRENMREGYPMQNDDGSDAANQGPFPLPEPKTFVLPHGRGEVSVPNGQSEGRELALRRTSDANGYPMEPTGDPMVDGVGPASWAPRRDVPELDGHGHPKIIPMVASDSFHVSAGRDPRGMPVIAGDRAIVGKINDMWIDEPEQLVRYLEIELDPEFGEGKRLVPLTMARIHSDHVVIRSIFGSHFNNVPRLASDRQVTMLEEEKICAYYAGGTLYAGGNRNEPVL